MAANTDLWALTEKEKQTLRLIVRGHDAKSTARSLGLSVHTINERLRDARRKMAVSSSREAARLLLAAEAGDEAVPPPDLLRDRLLGDDRARPAAEDGNAPIHGAGRAHRRPWIVFGGLVMIFALGLLALAAVQVDTPLPSATDADADPQVVEIARHWLALGDQGDWKATYQATGAEFHRQNSLQTWAAVSEKVRAPLGAMLSRTLVSEESIPAPPYGYEMVKFRTRFANRPDVLETLTLDREQGQWRVTGVTID